MKKLVMTSMFTLALLSMSPSKVVYAQSGSHGGNILDVNGTQRLFDLVAKAKCRLVPGTELYPEVRDLDQALNKIATKDWYLASSIRREVQRLTFCFTGELRKIDPSFWDFWDHPEDRYSPVNGDDAQFRYAKQGGVRLNDWVYVDEDKYNSLSVPGDQAKFIIHETMHSYLSPFLPDWKRKIDLWTMVSVLSDIIDGKDVTESKLHYYMSKLDVDFPRDVDQLTPYRKQVEYLVAGSNRRKALILAEANPEVLVDVDVNQINVFLNKRDVQSDAALVVLADDLGSILVDGTVDEFKSILGRPYQKIGISSIAMSKFSSLSTEKKNLFLGSTTIQISVQKTLAEIEKMKLIQGQFVVFAGSDVQSFGAAPLKSEPVALTSIEPRRWTNDYESALPVSVQALSELIQYLYQSGYKEELKKLLTENEAFYHALGLKSLISQLNGTSFHFPMEKKVAQAVLFEVRDGAIQSFVQSTLKIFRPEQQDELRAMIHFEKFKN